MQVNTDGFGLRDMSPLFLHDGQGEADGEFESIGRQPIVKPKRRLAAAIQGPGFGVRGMAAATPAAALSGAPMRSDLKDLKTRP